ncbi:probable ATP-dependent RNA helicase Dbp73D [Ctenocephalides felis]|uniref:probable ATP-dependent RNA helicase Dbp73D n=1 Tax=Ctenocephalides felis TaxID=7515 RepID=UPI000E6E1EC2|nr:probable ATP-dependent RNA helicase Dbp73D [Ctenocephalides felis]
MNQNRKTWHVDNAENEKTVNAQDAAKEKNLEDTGFTILGNENFQKKLKVKRVLPYWLANPTVMSSDLKNNITSIDTIDMLNETIKNNLKALKIDHFFPVQTTLIPWLLQGINVPEPLRQSDVCVSPQQEVALLTRRVRKVRALVVLPVHELAVQVYKVFQSMVIGTDLKVTLLAAQKTLVREQSFLVKKSCTGEYLSNCDILVCTAGRLVEHLHSTPGFTLKGLRYLVLDEADKTMEQTQNDWLLHVDNHLRNEFNQTVRSTTLSLKTLKDISEHPQKWLFSATLSQDPEKLQKIGLFQPRLFTTVSKSLDDVQITGKSIKRGDFIGKYTTPEELKEYYCITNISIKPLAMLTLIKEKSWKQVLCFTNSSKAAHRLSLLLHHMAPDMKISELSAALDFKTREDTLQKFAKGEINILISTDALARGMDIDNVDVVLSYDAPHHIKNYIHRVGRTGRAGKCGEAVTFIEKSFSTQFQAMIKSSGKNALPEIEISSEALENNMEKYRNALESLKTTLQKEEQTNVIVSKMEKKGKLKRKKNTKASKIKKMKLN